MTESMVHLNHKTQQRMLSRILAFLCFTILIAACQPPAAERLGSHLPAAEILGKPGYTAISFGGYRHASRDTVPTIAELKEDLAILRAMGIKVLRTYNTQQFGETANLLEAIKQMKDADPTFEMYVMLGAWINRKDAFTANPDHTQEDADNNKAEIDTAVSMANAYPDIVKVIAVGNEAMVHWAASYFVEPGIILKWVKHLRQLRDDKKLPADIWITSSDNFASWGGGDSSYFKPDLDSLIKAVDYISMHTYPFHDSHYNPAYWQVPATEKSLPATQQISAAMDRAANYAKTQYQSVQAYVKRLGVSKPIHIGETGWASVDTHLYGAEGSKAADEYKQKLYYDHLRAWTDSAGIACFFFEAFDEPLKDARNVNGSENHFGLINIQGEAKYALWSMVDQGVFKGLTRNGRAIGKTFGGDSTALLSSILPPALAK